MPIRRELYEEIAARHEREHRVDSRAQRWFWVRVAALCWVWSILGLVVAAYGFHTTDEEIGHICLWTGELIVLVGVMGTVWRALVVSEERGWR